MFFRPIFLVVVFALVLTEFVENPTAEPVTHHLAAHPAMESASDIQPNIDPPEIGQTNIPKPIANDSVSEISSSNASHGDHINDSPTMTHAKQRAIHYPMNRPAKPTAGCCG